MLTLISSRLPAQGQTRRSEEGYPQATEDHRRLIEGYLQSHRIRNHSSKTIDREKKFLEGWFESHSLQGRPLYTWEAMIPVQGRKVINDYSKALMDSGLRSETVRAYLGILNRYFSCVLVHPFFIHGRGP
jgi:hypothetical protein